MGGQGRKWEMEEGHENVPEGGADASEGPEVGQPKNLPWDARQPACPEWKFCAGTEDTDHPFSTWNVFFFLVPFPQSKLILTFIFL